MRIDNKSRCKVSGCTNLGDVNKVVNNKVYRRKWCSKHKREQYGMKGNPSCKFSSKEKFKQRGLNDICWICGWERYKDKGVRTTCKE